MSIAQTSRLAQYAAYEDPDTHTILFMQTTPNYYRERPPKHKYFRYNTQTITLYRVYAKDKKKVLSQWWRRTDEVACKSYIDAYGLRPVWPPHMKVDIGL